jgi:hypothetical protein
MQHRDQSRNQKKMEYGVKSRNQKKSVPQKEKES